VAAEAPATAPFAGFTVLEGPPAYLALSPAAGTDAPPPLLGGDGGEAGGVLPDVIEFVKLLGGLRRADAQLPAPGKLADLIEAAGCFRWPSADSVTWKPTSFKALPRIIRMDFESSTISARIGFLTG
jgi:hypothetical protein